MKTRLTSELKAQHNMKLAVFVAVLAVGADALKCLEYSAAKNKVPETRVELECAVGVKYCYKAYSMSDFMFEKTETLTGGCETTAGVYSIEGADSPECSKKEPAFKGGDNWTEAWDKVGDDIEKSLG